MESYSTPQLSRNEALRNEFNEYCKAHPEERFWQAVRNWCGYNFIMAGDMGNHLMDTFYWERKNKKHPKERLTKATETH